MRVMVALGGNALLRRGEALTPSRQRANAAIAAGVIAQLAAEHTVVVTHGNGPQVGLLALQNEAQEPTLRQPLDVLGAESDGMIGYILQQELRNHLPDRHVATVLTQVVVDDRDPAFGAPTKFVGPVYDEAGASAAAAEHGWTVAPDGPHWRRVVPSPEPREIIEVRAVEALVSAGIITVCAGGGGIPVRRDSSDMLHGVEAVVDKDLTAALLAAELGADALLLLTDVDAVYRAWGTDDASRLACVSPEGARQVAAPAGSMGPKLEAAARFVEAGGALAGIGALEDAGLILSGEAGTIVT